MNTEEPTLISHITEVRSGYIPEGGISTVIFCGKVRGENDLPQVMHLHRNMIEMEDKKRKKIKSDQSAYITGILIGQGSSVIHLMEGPSDAITRVLASLADHDQFREQGIQSGRIVYCVEDRPERYFPEWFSCTLEERRSNAEDVTAESCNGIVHDMANGLLNVGHIIGTESQEEVELGKYTEHLPGKNLVTALANCSAFFTLQEYVDLFAAPFFVDLDSEQDWPIERLVQY